MASEESANYRPTKTKILVIEYEEFIVKILRSHFPKRNFTFLDAHSGKSGLHLFCCRKPDIVIIDWRLPDTDGKDLVSKIRNLSVVPIIICSSSNADHEIIEALDCGADAFVAKPFNPQILIAHIHSALRRAAWNVHESVKEFLIDGPIKIDLLKHSVTVNNNEIAFSPKEFYLLKLLMMHKGKILTHRDILQEVWGKAHTHEYQYLRVQIAHIREKLRQHLGSQEVIHTEPCIGYRLQILDS